jgi:hypothetical protein
MRPRRLGSGGAMTASHHVRQELGAVKPLWWYPDSFASFVPAALGRLLKFVSCPLLLRS